MAEYKKINLSLKSQLKNVGAGSNYSAIHPDNKLEKLKKVL
jgi:hypothetical protein